ncbi:ABC transporter substrate-binding protein [Candidatus Dependentiae bacterium]|nr:ABC transporter substrate-binding protein [Candidatus Dependentiae bacterium]
MKKNMFFSGVLFLLLVLNLPLFAEIKIGGIFAKTGPAGFLGLPEDKSVTLLVEQINSKGGINGEKIVYISKDSMGNPEKAILLAKELVEQEKVIAILGPSTTGESLKIKDYCNENQVILISCAAAEEIVSPVLKYVFKTPQKDSDAARRIFETMKKNNIKKVGVLTSNSGFGSTGKSQLEKLAPGYGIEIAASEVYDKSLNDLTAVLKKVQEKNVQGIINWSIEPAQGIIAKNMKQIGLNIPLFQSHGYGNIKYVKMSGDASENIVFPCGRLVVADKLADNHIQKKVLSDYKTAFETRFKEEASAFGGYAYDALMIIIKAVEKSGSDKEKIRDAIENTKKFVGTSGVFNFSEKDHNGLAKDSFEMITVKKGLFEIYK